MAKFKTGDKVKIVNYGHLIWQNKLATSHIPDNIVREDENVYWIDANPQIVGKEAVVERSGNGGYSLSIGAWFHDNQLELIEN